MSGWIKIHRAIQEHWIYQDPTKYWWWTDMLFLASYKDNRVVVKNQLIDIKRGQFLGSLSFFTKRWNVSKDKVINFLKLLELDGMILKKSDKNLTLITICNYESYQDLSDNISDNLSYNNPDNISDNLPDTTKESKERKEILDINTNAHTREEKISFNAEREQGFFNTFKGTGVGVSVARATGKKANEIFQLLDIFMAECQIRESGHKDFQDFKEHFLNAIKGEYISLPAQPQVQPKKKVITNEDLYKEMYGL